MSAPSVQFTHVAAAAAVPATVTVHQCEPLLKVKPSHASACRGMGPPPLRTSRLATEMWPGRPFQPSRKRFPGTSSGTATPSSPSAWLWLQACSLLRLRRRSLHLLLPGAIALAPLRRCTRARAFLSILPPGALLWAVFRPQLRMNLATLLAVSGIWRRPTAALTWPWRSRSLTAAKTLFRSRCA